jgi:D-alanyl-D-alanine carboxypeptidase (penicillin-binding protein 5/6)
MGRYFYDFATYNVRIIAMRKSVILGLTSLLLLIGGYGWWALGRPLVISSPNIKLPAFAVKAHSLAWPTKGRAAIGYLDATTKSVNCRSFGDQNVFPIASLTKIITSLVVLDKYPLENGQDGAILTMTDQDVARLNVTRSQNGSYVPVQAGQQLTERQVLQAVMLASANNLADSLAIWAFGTMADYQTAAGAWLTKHQLYYTTIGNDASGFDAGTKSSSLDICKLMLMATNNQTLAEIMNTVEISDFPIIGRLKNTNRLLGQGGIFAGKTGFTDEAGHGLVLAARIEIDGQPHLVALAVLGQDSYNQVFSLASQLLDSASQNLIVRQITETGQTVGYLKTAWGAKTDLLAVDELKLTTWIDETPNLKMTSQQLDSETLPASQIVGQIMTNDQSIDIVTKNQIGSASPWWRLLNGF